MSAAQELLQRLEDGLTGFAGSRLGLAVSGGSDSVALLRLAAIWSKAREVSLFCYTVDHGLRPESAQEAAFVAGLCADLGVPCKTLVWTGWDGQGNKSAAARDGRYDLMAQAASEDSVTDIALAHTQDDQAETVVMRLARKAGVDGLAAMAPSRLDRGIVWRRPLLAATREELRGFLGEIGQDWRDDPSNEDPDYDRIRIRQSSDQLAKLGLTSEALAAVASNMQQAQAALDEVVLKAAQTLCEVKAGAVTMPLDGFMEQPTEIRRRLLSELLRWVSSGTYPPRREALSGALEVIGQGQTTTLAGCLIFGKSGQVWVTREPAAVAETEARVGDLWDRRWCLLGKAEANEFVIRCLGETGLSYCEAWRDLGIPRPVLLSTPAVWQADRLIAAPLAGYVEGWQAKLSGNAEDFPNALVKR